MTRRSSYLAIAAAVVAFALAVTSLSGLKTAAVEAAGDCTVADNTFDAEEKAFAGLINKYRTDNSLAKLTVSVNLNREASWHAKDMADKAYFSHTDSLGRSPEVRGKDCGTKTLIGENIAAGTVRDTAQEAFDAWKASSGHNQNMLKSGYKQIGIARYYKAGSPYGWYWVTDFSLNTDGTDVLGGGGTTPPASTPTKTPTPPPATSTPGTAPSSTAAKISSPVPGSKITNTSATFKWNQVTTATRYQLYIGTTPGSYNVKNVATTGTSLSVSGLPRGSVKLYVRLWTQAGGTWKYVDYTYTGPN